MTSSDKEFPEDSSFSPKASTSKLPTDASPDSKCPICLDRFDNVAYLDRCLHRFCFRCVQEWSKNKAECPLCKQPFFSIFHTIRAEDDFKEYVLSPSENSSFASPDGQRFRYRTTLTGERRTVSSSSRRTLSPPDNGILFEGLSSEPVRQRDGEIQQMIRRLASRRQASAEGRSLRQIQEEDMINFRRALYRTGVRIRSIQDGGRYRDISAEFFRHNPACLHRLVPWLKRELTVLFGAHGSLVNIVQHIIMSNVTRYDLESQAFADDLKPFLLNRTEHFLHEFISFARCPFNLEAYDQHANYDCPAPSYDEGSHSDSSIITISPDVAYSQGPDNSLSVTGLDHAPWDDETPGPSYSISEEVRTTIASPLETSESSDDGSASKSRRTKLQTRLQANVDSNDSDSSSDNCVIVGYVKPLAERTPEVVELSSDSEESIREEKRETVKKQQPIQCRSWSDSEPSRSFSPHSPTYKEGVGSCRSCLSPAIEKTESKDGNKNKYKVKGLSHRDLSWSPSPGSDTVCSPWNHRLSRKGKSRSPQSCSRYSRSSHGHRSRREHRSKHQLKRRQSRSRDSSKYRSKRSSRKSRAHDTRVSLKSQRGSLSHESTPSREVSRSRSRSEGHGKRRSRSRDSDRYYVRDNYQSKYQWGYAFCSRKVFGDGYESSSRRRTQSNALYSRQSASPEYRIRSFVERTDPHSQKGLHERQYYCYERCRSRSRSSNRSRTPSGGTDRMKSEKPGGKRKYKTRHLESAFKETTSLERENDPKKTSSKFSDCYKSEDSLSDNRASSETKRKKKKKKMRSPSVEIVYEGKATDTTRHLKKKKKKHKKKHRKHHTSNSAHSSPVVITIDSDSSKEPESTECDSSITWMDRTQINERENESPSSFLGRTGCEDFYKVGEETGGAAKKYSVPTRKGDLDGDMRNADVKLRDSSITWMGRTQINERENESPSSFLGRTGCEDFYKVGEETGGAAKKYSVPTRKGDLDGDMRNADVKLRDSSITWMGRTQINERENESPSSFLGRTGCEDFYKVGEETGGAAKKYSVPTRKGDLDGDMRNADVKLRDSSITWMGRTQINERENESPSSFLGRTGCEDFYKVGEETGGAAKKYSVPTRKGDLDGDMRNADVKLRDSSITWMGRTQINERENESPSSFLGRTGCEDFYKVGEETGGAAKKYSVPTRKGDLDGDMRNADVKLRDSSITWMGRTQINERENESPSSFLGRTGCEDFYKVGEETGGAAKKYSVPTRKGDLDGDMRNADVKLRDSSITWMGRTQINERENESPSSFLGRTGCEDFYKVGEETGGAAKKYSVPTRKGDLDGDMRNADVKLRDSSITWMGRTQINERENESPSSFLGRTGCEDFYKVGEETGGAAKKYSVPTRKGDLDGDMRNADVKLRETAADRSLSIVDTSSNTPHTETVTSYIQEAPAAPSSQLPSPRISFLECPERQPLMLRLPKGLVNRSSWFDFPEEEM